MRRPDLGQKIFFYFTAFVAGLITLSLELLGFRVLAPYFGYSIYVFGSLIGLILLAMAAGYLLGGTLGIRMGEKRFFLVILSGGLYIALAAISYPFILDRLQNIGLISGVLLATFILYAVPMVLFAAVAPYLIGRLASFGETAGRSAGVISGLGTLGSLAGTFLTSFFLLPSLGTRLAFLIIALAGVSLPILWLGALQTKKALIVLAIPLVLFGYPPYRKLNVIKTTDSPYAHLEVVDYGDLLALRAEHRSGSAYSVIPKNDRWNNQATLYSLFAVPPLLNHGEKVLLLGLGAGTLPLVHEELNPTVRMTAVEIDPKVVAIGKEYFNLSKRKNLDRVVVEDVRPFLSKDDSKYDVVEVDLFQGGTEIPFYLATKEFFSIINVHLNEQGILAMNVYDPQNGQPILGSILTTLRAVYPYVYKVPAGSGSFFVLAAQNELSLPDDIQNSLSPNAQVIANYFRSHLIRIENTEGILLTDDRSPLEKLYGISS